MIPHYFLICNASRAGGNASPDYLGNRSNTQPRPRAVAPFRPKLPSRYQYHYDRPTRAYFLPRPPQPNVFSSPLSNPSGYTPAACTVRVSDHTTDEHIAQGARLGPEKECSANQMMEQKEAAEPKEWELIGAEQRVAGNPAQESNEESHTTTLAQANQRFSCGTSVPGASRSPSASQGIPATFRSLSKSSGGDPYHGSIAPEAGLHSTSLTSFPSVRSLTQYLST